MRVRVLGAVLAAALLPSLAASEETCPEKCQTEMRACDAANCAPGRQECAAKCEGPKDIKCRVACIKEFEPCFKPCADAQTKCLDACKAK